MLPFIGEGSILQGSTNPMYVPPDAWDNIKMHVVY